MVTRKLPEAVEARLRRDYEPLFNVDDHVYSTDELTELAADADALLPCHSEHLNAEMEQGAVYHERLETLLAACEVLSLHCPATPETRHLIDAERIRALDNLNAIFAGREPGDQVA